MTSLARGKQNVKIYIDMIETHTIENKDDIEQLIKQHRFKGTQFRVNVVADAETYALPKWSACIEEAH